MGLGSFAEVFTENLPSIIQGGVEIARSIFGDDDQERVTTGQRTVVLSPGPAIPRQPVATQLVNIPGVTGTVPAQRFGPVQSVLGGLAADFASCVARGGSVGQCLPFFGGEPAFDEPEVPQMPGAAGAPTGTVPAPMAVGGGCIFPQTRMPTSRYPSTVQFLDQDTSGNTRCVTYKNMGRPLLYSGDMTACRRVERVARRARRASRKR